MQNVILKMFRGVANFLAKLGIRLMCATVRIACDDVDKLRGDLVAGFWHGDSQAALILLKLFKKQKIRTNVVVTAEWRGDVIGKTVRRYGHSPIRMPNGAEIRHFLSELKQTFDDKSRIFAVALDGPLGPKHEPKKILFRLANEAKREVVVLWFEYSKVLRLNRWDDYAIPLPFSKITTNVATFGIPTREEVKEFTQLERRILTSTGVGI